ncbi:MAG: hypothetical protein ABSC34_10525 [Acidimicrobiales bacterium]
MPTLDPTELLAGANPVATYEIDPARLDQMITRVTATPLPTRLSLLRTWQMRAGSLAAAAALVTGLVISLGSSPQGLSVLALSASTPVAGNATPSPASTGLTFAAAKATVPSSVVVPPTNLGVGRTLATNAGRADVFKFVSIADPGAKLTRIAHDLGLLGGVTSPTCPWRTIGTNATLSGARSPSIGCASTGSTLAAPITWRFNMRNPVCPPTTTPPATSTSRCPSVQNATGRGATTHQLVAWSSPLLARLSGEGLVVGGATWGTPIVNAFDDTIYYPLVVDDTTLANQYEEFQFTSYGLLIHASGLLGRTSLVDAYPLISQAAGVALIENPSPATSVNPGGPMIPATTSTTKPSNDVVKVATLEYELASLRSGGAVLVPQYVYLTSRGVRYQALALNPSFFTDRAGK